MEIGQASDTETETLASIREEIDRVDGALVALLGTRVGLALRAAEEKRARGQAELRDVRREAEIARRVSLLARESGLDPELVRNVFWRILGMSHGAVEGDGERTRPGGSHPEEVGR